MTNRKRFLIYLRKMFGDCSRQAFLQKLSHFDSDVELNNDGYQNDCDDYYNDGYKKACSDTESNCDNDIERDIDIGSNADYSEPPAQFQPQVKLIDINGTDAWFKHVQALKNISSLNACLERFKSLLGKSTMIVYRNSVQKSLAAMPTYVDKHFKEPQDITDETSEDVARHTGKFVMENVADLLRACHRGKVSGRNEEQKFYNDFEAVIESYLESIGVYRKDIALGADIRSNAMWFETPLPKETFAPEKIGTICEIELSPHIIYYRNDNGVREDVIIRGVCIVFSEARQR